MCVCLSVYRTSFILVSIVYYVNTKYLSSSRLPAARRQPQRPIAPYRPKARAVASVFRCTTMGALWVCRAVALRMLPTIQSEYRVQSTPAAAAVRASSSSRRSPPKSRNEVNSSHNTETHIQIHPETTGGDGKHPQPMNRKLLVRSRSLSKTLQNSVRSAATVAAASTREELGVLVYHALAACMLCKRAANHALHMPMLYIEYIPVLLCIYSMYMCVYLVKTLDHFE